MFVARFYFIEDWKMNASQTLTFHILSVGSNQKVIKQMSKILNIGVEQDHLDSLTKATGISALAELIWNSLDADATEIKINYKKNSIGGYEYIKISDNGHGLDYIQAQNVFSKLGG